MPCVTTLTTGYAAPRNIRRPPVSVYGVAYTGTIRPADTVVQASALTISPSLSETPRTVGAGYRRPVPSRHPLPVARANWTRAGKSRPHRIGVRAALTHGGVS